MISANGWTFVVVIWDGEHEREYRDGALVYDGPWRGDGTTGAPK